MYFNVVLILTSLFISGVAQAIELPKVIVSSCTYKGSTLLVESEDLGGNSASHHFAGTVEMTQLTDPSKYFGGAKIGTPTLQILGVFLNDKILLKVLVKDTDRVLVREMRSANWRASSQPKRYHAFFSSPIVNEIKTHNPDFGSPSWSARFPKNELVINNLEISCLVKPSSKRKTFLPW